MNVSHFLIQKCTPLHTQKFTWKELAGNLISKLDDKYFLPTHLNRKSSFDNIKKLLSRALKLD